MTDDPSSDEYLARVQVGEQPAFSGRIELAEYDPAWSARFEREAARIREVLGERALQVEHVGSTSVPGLVAKPIIDLDLVVADSADEAAYVPDLEAAGYRLTIREPDWYEHRLFKGPDTNINLHVFSPGSAEVTRHRRLRDWLRGNAGDRDLYARTKRELATRQWRNVQEYSEAKGEVVAAILARATGAS